MTMHVMRNRTARMAAVGLISLVITLVFVAYQRTTGAQSASPLPAVEDYVALVSPNVPEYQRSVLADGIVTFAEHEDAKRRTVQCGEAAGLRMGHEPVVGLRPSHYSITAATETEMDASIEMLKTCEHEYMTEIESVWSLAKAHHSDAERGQAFDQLTACMRAKGADVPPAGIKTVAELDQIRTPAWDNADAGAPAAKAALLRRAQYHYCAREIEEKTGFLLP